MHRCLIKVKSGVYGPLYGQCSFRNALQLQSAQRKGLIEGLTQLSTTKGCGLHYPSLKIPKLDFHVFIQQQGHTAEGCLPANTCCV